MLEPQEIEDEEYEQVAGRVAAIDVAKATGMVCTRVPHPSRPGKRRTTVREAAAATGAVLEVAEQLVGERIELVTPECSVGLLADLVLRARGGRAARAAGERPGREERPGPPEDGQARCGVAGEADRAGDAAASFVPPAEIRRLRDYTRLRTNLTRERTRHWSRLEKLLEDARSAPRALWSGARAGG